MFKLPLCSTRVGDPAQCYSSKPCRYRTEHADAGRMTCGCLGGRPSICTPPRPLSRELILHARTCRELEDRERTWAQTGYRAWRRFRSREYRLMLEELRGGELPAALLEHGSPRDEAVLVRDRAARIAEGLRWVLTPEEFALLWARHVEGETLQHIGDRLGMGAPAVHKKLQVLVKKARAQSTLR